MAERLVVIGGDAGGMGAASQARRLRPGLEIVALERGGRTSWSACGIPYLVGGEVEHLDDLVVRSPEEFRDRLRIDVRLHHEVVGADLDRREVEVRDHDAARTFRLGFDQLVFGTGARPRRPDLPGADRKCVFGVQTLDDAAALLGHARDSGGSQVVVVGGGYIGLEMAEAFTHRGARVSQAMRRHGIDVRCGTATLGFDEGVVHTEAGDLPADLVVLGLGVVPNSELAGDAGIALGAGGAVAVDDRQATDADGVWAAGDCCESTHLVTGGKVHVPLGTVANKQARVAGTNLAGGDARFPGVVGTAAVKLCATEIARTGLSEREATGAGLDHTAVHIDSTTRAGYLAEAPALTVKMVAERGSGRLLGAPIVGGSGSAKRIDVVATALHAGMTASQVSQLDLAYAPPFSPAWDPVLIAARKAGEQAAAAGDR